MIAFLSDKESKTDEKHGPYINVHQNVAIDELQEDTIETHLKDEVPRNPSMHAAYRSVLGQISWLQSRSMYQSNASNHEVRQQ